MSSPRIVNQPDGTRTLRHGSVHLAITPSLTGLPTVCIAADGHSLANDLLDLGDPAARAGFVAGLNGHAEDAAQALALAAGLLTDDAEPPALIASRFALRPIDAAEARPVDWLVDGVLPAGALVFMSGEAGCFKSFHALDLALSVASGTDWHGREVRPGTTVYLAGEGQGGIANRREAWQQAHDHTDTSHCFLGTVPVQFLADGDVDAFLAEVAGLSEPPALIVVDTLSRSAVGANENQQDDMSRFVAGLDRVRAVTGAAVLVLHHHNKLGDYRGSSVLMAAADTWLTAKADGDAATLSVIKQKDADAGPPLALRRQVRVIAHAPDGAEVTSLVFAPEGDAARLSAAAHTALGVLVSDGLGGITATEWETLCANAGLRRSTFYDAKRELTDRAMVAGATVSGPAARGARITPTAAGIAAAKVRKPVRTFAKTGPDGAAPKPEGPTKVRDVAQDETRAATRETRRRSEGPTKVRTSAPDPGHEGPKVRTTIESPDLPDLGPPNDLRTFPAMLSGDDVADAFGPHPWDADGADDKVAL